MRSMTGYGRGEAQTPYGVYTVEIKSVNHRFFEMAARLPKEFSPLEIRLRKYLQSVLRRGRVNVTVDKREAGRGERVLIDYDLASQYRQRLKELAEKCGVVDDTSTSLLINMPDVLQLERTEEDEETLWGYLKDAVDEALEKVLQTRLREGEDTKKELEGYIQDMARNLLNIEKRAKEIVQGYKERLWERVQELSNGLEVDESRLAMEVAIFASRCDIAEEVARLKSFIDRFQEMLEEDAPVGRTLDFIIQEMRREVNTIGAKVSDFPVSENVVQMKSLLEKMREQVQNVE